MNKREEGKESETETETEEREAKSDSMRHSTFSPDDNEESRRYTVTPSGQNPSSSSCSTTSEQQQQKTCDVLAKGTSSLLDTVIRNFDGSAESAVRSQDQLSSSIDRLTEELDQLLEDAPLPFIMQHASKISGVRNRVSSLNTLLKSIQQRIDNIDRMLSTGFSHDAGEQNK